MPLCLAPVKLHLNYGTSTFATPYATEILMNWRQSTGGPPRWLRMENVADEVKLVS